ncbi:MAG: hypothetical protein JSU81_06030 [Candidatus Coatesbacteria bacterium]|nr:MAG: hypothetical protein JSU81_06030 [Candidatus Coatesbacteria bacterium]
MSDELIIQGLTLEQYALYSAEANLLRQKWEQSEGSLDIRDEMLGILKKYSQNPATCMDEEGNLNYHACGLIAEWHDVINKDAEMMTQYSQISGDYVSKQMFGTAEATAGETVEGVTLEQYAETAAKTQHASEVEAPGIIMNLGYYKDMDHYGRVRDAFTKAMEEDVSLKLATHFGQLFAKYGTAHMEAATQHTIDVVAEAIEEGEDRDALIEEAVREVVKRAAAGDVAGIVDYLKQTFPDDADDNDALDWYLDKACDLLAEAGNRDAARHLLGVRHGLVGEDEDREEWIESELDSLF